MNNYKELLEEGLKQLCGVENSETTEKLLAFMDLVLETNKSMNLTAITEPEDFVIKHFIDSFTICKSKEFESASSIVDVGTGGGFPGMPLAIVYPEKKFVLMDSLNKRIKFLIDAADSLGLKNVECVHSRAEDFGKNKKYRENFDLCVSRAVANIAVLSEYCIPLVKPGGSFTAYKTGNEDLSLGNNAIKTLGGSLGEIAQFPKLEGILSFIEADHRLVNIKKIKNTPKAYPRKAGTPAKNPL